MEPTLRPSHAADFEFSFEAKRQALGPHVASRWGWDEPFQRELHRKRWSERPWFIITLDEQAVGTVAVEQAEDHIRFGEFYVLAQAQGKGIGSNVLASVLRRADAQALPVRLEYLKWNPVASLYKRNGFTVVRENDTHYFLERQPCGL